MVCSQWVGEEGIPDAGARVACIWVVMGSGCLGSHLHRFGNWGFSGRPHATKDMETLHELG